MKIRHGLALAALTCATASAGAQTVYIGGAGGATRSSADCSGTISCDNSDTGWKAYAGYNVNPMFGVEMIGYDFGGNQRHGIVREIDTEQRYDDTHDRRFPVSGVAATSPDAPADLQVSGDDARTTVRIGDPSRTVTGRHTYQITYAVAAVTTRLADHDELYWNAFGPDWPVPAQTVTVRVTGAPVSVMP